MSRYTGRRRLRREAILWGLAAFFLLLAILCLAVFPGVRFSGALSLALAALCLGLWGLGRWAEHSRRGKYALWALRGLLCVGLLLFGVVEGLLFARGRQENEALPADAVLILGAGVNGETPSLILKSRIDAAADYLQAHPDVPAILSGGQGPGEDITEAECMRRELRKRGIADNRLYLEEESTSTAENFAFSQKILSSLGAEAVAVVTSDFHCLRAHLIAQRAGLSTFTLPARADWPLLNANYYLREFFALGKTLLLD